MKNEKGGQMAEGRGRKFLLKKTAASNNNPKRQNGNVIDAGNL
jgi:hypothetical protein